MGPNAPRQEPADQCRTGAISAHAAGRMRAVTTTSVGRDAGVLGSRLARSADRRRTGQSATRRNSAEPESALAAGLPLGRAASIGIGLEHHVQQVAECVAEWASGRLKRLSERRSPVIETTNRMTEGCAARR